MACIPTQSRPSRPFPHGPHLEESSELNGADTAFVLISAFLVMLMTPGLAFFYGGMVRVKSALNMLMMSFVSLGIVSILWVLYGYSLAFGPDTGGVVGNLDFVGLKGITAESLTEKGGIPVFAFALFQMMFAIITPALMSGALADRVKFSAWAVFIALWATVVYFPVAHWVWAEGGWLFELGVIDFAGGTAVHINAGIGALAAVLVVGKRIGFKKEPMRPHSLPLVVLGAALLWFGWFGFNAGSAARRRRHRRPHGDEHAARHGRGRPGLARLRARPARRLHHAGCRLRRRRRPGRDHPGRARTSAPSAPWSSASSPARSARGR